ncbi:MAG: alpha/beta hydrolase-fold protein [Vicinamibacterales bacterium]
MDARSLSPRRRVRTRVLGLVTMAAAATALVRAGAPQGPAPGAARGADAPLSFTVPSRVLGEARLVNVQIPAACAGRSPCPVLYMPDGGMHEDFPHVAAAVTALMTDHRIRPTILVGVPNTARRRDLTGPTTVDSDRAIAPVVGGSAAFRRFLRDELIPEVTRRFHPADERAIVGESLAGLFVIETFLVEPALFTHYVALDPSLWWNGGALVASAGDQLGALHATPRSIFFASADTPEMVAACERLAATLRTRAPGSLRWHYQPRPDLTHATIFRGIEATALAFALR